MKIRMLGTGYGECKIKKKFSRDLRGRGGIVIDEKILLDAPSDIFDVAEGLGYSDIFSGISDVIISHSHAGHLSVEAILKLSAKKRIRVYATKAVLSLLPDVFEIEKIPLEPFAPVEIEDYRLIPLPSNHSTDVDGEVCLNFIIARDKAVFFAIDGGGINYEAWQVLKEVRLDCVVAECALECKDYCMANMFHQSRESLAVMKKMFVCSGTVTEGTRFLLTHIPSERKRSIHDELSALAAELSMTVTYDGYFANV